MKKIFLGFVLGVLVIVFSLAITLTGCQPKTVGDKGVKAESDPCSGWCCLFPNLPGC